MVKLNLDIPQAFFQEELRDGYIVSADMKRIWAVEIDLLAELLRVCKKCEIRMFAAGGTMLGTVRHHGMVPWDDDIDIMLFRDDFIKLCNVAKSEFKYPYFFQTEVTDPGSFRGHAQLRNVETTGILKHELEQRRNICQGIFIDIFPLDRIPDNSMNCKSHLILLKLLRLAHRTCLIASLPYNFLSKDFKRSVACLVLHILLPKPLSKRGCLFFYKKWEYKVTIYNDTQTRRVILTPFTTMRWVYDQIDFEPKIEQHFEMLKIPIPIGYKKMLKHTYGNWEKYVIGTSLHGGIIFDTERSYMGYL